MPTVAHVRIPYLAPTLRYIYQQITGTKRYRSLVITNRCSNEAMFPFEPIFLTRQIADLATFAREQHINLTHAQFGSDGLRFLPFKAAMGVPMVTTFRGRDATLWSQNTPDYRQDLHNLLRQGDHFIADSQDLKKTLLTLGCPADKVSVLYSGIDIAEFNFRYHELRRENDRLQLICIGRLTEKKGIDTLIRALSHLLLRRPRTHLTIIGDGVERGALERLVVELKLQDAVEFRGWLPNSEIAAALDEADIFCLASRPSRDGDIESIPNAIKEAMACGIPVVSTRHGGIPEIVRHERTGLLVEPDDPERLAQALLRLSLDHPLVDRLTRAARLLVEEDYDLLIQMERLEDLYDEIVVRHGELHGPKSSMSGTKRGGKTSLAKQREQDQPKAKHEKKAGV